MARKLEIERKFLVHRDLLPPLPPGAGLRQGYLSFEPTVRVRVEECPDGSRRGYLTIKAHSLMGPDEFEYPIPFPEAEALLELTQASLISKTRHRIELTEDPDLAWEVDVFHGDNEGLTVAELELPREDYPHPRPDWLGEEVTLDPAYKNAALALRPFNAW